MNPNNNKPSTSQKLTKTEQQLQQEESIESLQELQKLKTNGYESNKDIIREKKKNQQEWIKHRKEHTIEDAKKLLILEGKRLQKNELSYCINECNKSKVKKE